MNAPEYFEIADGYGCFAPVGQTTFQESVEMVSRAIAFARDNHIYRLLVDITKLTGFESPGTFARFTSAVQYAREARSLLKGVMVARADFIDPNRFGVTVARNRGLFSNVFSSREEALQWLLDPDAG